MLQENGYFLVTNSSVVYLLIVKALSLKFGDRENTIGDIPLCISNQEFLKTPYFLMTNCSHSLLEKEDCNFDQRFYFLTTQEYLLGDRNLSIMPVAVSLMASFMSAITLLGVSAENYYFGMQFVVINISYGLATPIASHLYLPVFFGLQKTSTYEYLELRFGPNIRMIASLTYTLQMVLYNGIVLYAPAIVLESVTGLDRLISILVVGLACTFYSTVGGMKAVVFTDLLQSALMFGAVLSVVVFSSIQLGGFDQIFVKAREGGRLNFYK